VREEGDATPHLQVRVVDDTGAPWRIAVNVQSDTGSHVVFWLVDPLSAHPLLNGLAAVPAGFSAVTANADHALDFVRAPLFDWTKGRDLPPTGAASADDLQDLLSLYLEQCRAAGGEVYAFGAKFEQNLHKPIDADFGNTDGLHGIHDIHLNQGNTGSHAGDNGTWHDGGLVLVHPDRAIGLLLAFQTQRIPTDDHGAPTPDATPLSQLVAPTPTAPPPPLTPLVAGAAYLERALLNPAGADPGLEVVVIGNLATVATPLAGWRLTDKNGRSTTIGDVTLEPGASFLLALDGTGVQLGNKGGNLILTDAGGAQVDVVVYTAQDASVEDRYLRFRR
jgi:uncharacterized protein YukJ